MLKNGEIKIPCYRPADSAKRRLCAKITPQFWHNSKNVKHSDSNWKNKPIRCILEVGGITFKQLIEVIFLGITVHGKNVRNQIEKLTE